MDFTKGKEKISKLLDTLRDLLQDFWSKVIHAANSIPIKDLWSKIPAAKNHYTEGQNTEYQGPAAAVSPDDSIPGSSAGFGSIKGWFLRSFDPVRLPVWKRRLMFFGIGGFALLFLTLLIAALVLNYGKPKDSSVQSLASGPGIQPEELFFPAEPDFLPGFLPEREPRRFWSLDDIRPHWRNPGGSEQWRGEIKEAVDKLMEGVP